MTKIQTINNQNNVPKIAVILTDAQRRIQWVNDDFTTITGYHLHEVIGKKPSILQGEKTQKSVIQKLRTCLDEQISVKETLTNYRKNGEAYPCSLVVHPIFNMNRELTNYIAFEIDRDTVENEEEIPLMKLESKYHTSSLNNVEGYKLFERFKNMLCSEKLYLQPNISLKGMADLLSTNTKYLSQVVNYHTKQNFQNFINTYRISEVKEKFDLKEYKNLTLYGIALQCGFKNKSTFYKVFKEQMGCTPKEYLKQMNQKEQCM